MNLYLYSNIGTKSVDHVKCGVYMNSSLPYVCNMALLCSALLFCARNRHPQPLQAVACKRRDEMLYVSSHDLRIGRSRWGGEESKSPETGPVQEMDV